MSTLSHWANLALDLASTKTNERVGPKKVFRGITFSIKEIDDLIQLTNFGYVKNSPRKRAQLKQHYYNEKSIDSAKDLFKKILEVKKSGSVSINFHGTKTGDKKQDFCMCSMAITKLTKPKVRFDVFYRNVDIIKRFGADLIFLRDEVLPNFDMLPTDSINFYFSTVNLNPLFFPILVPYIDDWKGALYAIKHDDPRFYGDVIKWSYRFISPVKQTYRFIHKIQRSLPIIYGKELFEEFTNHINKEHKNV